MKRQALRLALSGAWAATWLLAATVAEAAPRIDNLSLRGLQAGGVTTLVISGAELLPEPKLHLAAPGASYQIKDGATAERLEVEFTIDGACPAGIYLLRAGSASGISEPAALGIDNLPQLPLRGEIAATPVALSGELTGSTIRSVTFEGKKDQNVVVEVEGRRLGSKLDAVTHVYDARRTQLAWSRPLPALGGDPRCTLKLPADGKYTVEVHDAVFRGAGPGFFRLKIGDFRYADLAFPLSAQQGTETQFELLGSNLPAGTKATGKLAARDGLARDKLPAPWPADLPLLSGARPVVVVTEHAELVEAEPSDKPQELPASPVAVSGRISKAGEQDRYRLAVTPGEQLRFDVLARRAGSPLDGVLSIQNEQGAELAAGDDRPGTSDPGLDFKVPDGVTALLLVVRDLRGQGSADHVYRLEAMPVGPSFSLSVANDRVHVPKDGAALVRVEVARSGYGGPIDLSFPNLPPSVSVTGSQIPAGASAALVTLSAPGLSPAQTTTAVIGTSSGERLALKRRASLAETAVTKSQPWLGDELGVAVVGPSPVQLVWDLFPSDSPLLQGVKLPLKLRVERGEGVKGAVRLSLLTTQKMPRKKIKENNQQREVDDVERALRFEAEAMIAAEAVEASPTILVPADLPTIVYDLAIQADLLADDSKTVVATVVTPARRVSVAPPLKLELAQVPETLEARAGAGPTATLAGTIVRKPGFMLPVRLSLAGLPEKVVSPTLVVAPEQADFSFPLSFAYGTAAGPLKDVKLSVTALSDPADPKTAAFTIEQPLTITIVPGTRPAEQPLAVFEDQSEFVANLNQGGGQAALDSEQKYSGTASVRVTPDQKYNPALPGLGLKIRENPGPGEYRYLRFAWKKQGGQAVCLQLNHDGQWGPAEGKPASFRYHAGPGGPVYGASVTVDAALPEEFEVVTRDLFADFGEFTLTGLALSPVDGEAAYFDHVYLGTSVDDFKLVKP